MKFRTFAAVLFPALLCFAQANNQSNSNKSATQVPSAGSCTAPCCKVMADNKDAKPCCHHDSAEETARASCGSGKDGNEAMACMKDQAKSADSGAVSCCGGNREKGCCAKPEKASEQSAPSCCAGSTDHCGMQHRTQDDIGK